MIIRVCVIDPEPRDPRNDVLVFQVPERSRQYELLVRLLEQASLDFVTIEAPCKHGRPEHDSEQRQSR